MTKPQITAPEIAGSQRAAQMAASQQAAIEMTAAQMAATLLVRAYQVALAPLAGGACRFTPSCSAYALDAIRIHGAARGLWLAARRIARCHPWGGFGHDPVPLAPLHVGAHTGASGAVAVSRDAGMGDRTLES